MSTPCPERHPRSLATPDVSLLHRIYVHWMRARGKPIDIREHTQPLLGEPPEQASTESAGSEAASTSHRDVFERITEILGYDIREAALMAEGYRELAGEMQSISESTLAAGFEVIPPE